MRERYNVLNRHPNNDNERRDVFAGFLILNKRKFRGSAS
jgi:hypothetical protein